MTEKAKIARQKLIDHMEKTHGHDATTDFLRLFGVYESARNSESYELGFNVEVDAERKPERERVDWGDDGFRHVRVMVYWINPLPVDNSV